MSTILKRSAKSMFIIAISKRLFLAVAIAIFLAATTIAVYANGIYNLYDDGYGRTTWVSCGSSAGNYFYNCYPDGHCEGMYDDPNGYNQGIADYECSERGY